MSRDYDWMLFINKNAALKEQFPPLSKVIKERPGSSTDSKRQRRIAEDNQMSKRTAERERYEASIEANAAREQRLEGERRRLAYNAYQAEKHAEKRTA